MVSEPSLFGRNRESARQPPSLHRDAHRIASKEPELPSFVLVESHGRLRRHSRSGRLEELMDSARVAESTGAGEAVGAADAGDSDRTATVR